MKLTDLKEAPMMNRDSPEMDDYYDNRRIKDRNTAEAPYYVKWSGQSHEWYGNGDPDQGDGRYKPKGDGGSIVAINIPSHEEAIVIAKKLNRAYDENKFPDDFVYGEWGKDYYFVEYHGAEAESMKRMDDWDKRAMLNDKPVDYAKGQKFTL